jgi:predicted permease
MCLQIVDQKDFESNGFIEALVAPITACGGNCCPNRFFFVSALGDGRFEAGEEFADSWADPIIEKWKGHWSIVVTSNNEEINLDRPAWRASESPPVGRSTSESLSALRMLSAARWEHGGPERRQITVRTSEGDPHMRAISVWSEAVWQDLKYGARQLWRSPSFTAAAAITLALGIGVNTSIFSLLNALLLRPLPGASTSGLVAIYRGDSRPCSYPDFLDFQQRGTAFSGLAADAPNESTLDVGDSGMSEMILVEGVSYNYASVLGTRPLLGRWFSAEDERAAAERFPAVISYRLWRSRFGAGPQAVGSRIRVESQWYTVIGVAAKEFRGLAPPIVTDVWLPLVRYALHNDYAARLVNNRQEAGVMMFGRLKPGVAASEAQAHLNLVDAQLRREYPRSGGRAAALDLETPRGASDPGSRRMVAQPAGMLAVVVALVLLIACANIATLLLTRGVGRRREVSIRIALGAGRARVCQQTLIESLLLSLLGAACGLAAATWTNHIQERAILSLPSPIAVGLDLSIDLRVLAFVLGASIVTTVLFGLMPALSLSGTELVPALKGIEVRLETHHRRFTLRNIYAVTQVTLSLMLLIAAGLFIRALSRASRIDLGFDPRGLLSARLFLPKPEFSETTGRDLCRRVLAYTRNLPGVSSATLSYASPMITASECVLPDDAARSRPALTAGANIVGPEYFSTLGIPLVRGRAFSAKDNSSAPSVVIVNEALAERYWPGGNAVGNRIRIGRGCEKGEGARAEIVGVVKNALYASLDSTRRPYVFLPIEQRFAPYVALLARTGGNPMQYATVLRKELRQLDSRLRIYEIEPVEHEIDHSLWQVRWEASMLSAFGALALVVATVGLYAVIAFGVRQRTREFGIRMALGARRRDVLRLVIGDGLALALVGICFGLVFSLLFTRLLRSFLYGLSPTDGATFAVVALLWTGVALLASCVPAYHSTRVDPLTSLRCE